MPARDPLTETQVSTRALPPVPLVRLPVVADDVEADLPRTRPTHVCSPDDRHLVADFVSGDVVRIENPAVPQIVVVDQVVEIKGRLYAGIFMLRWEDGCATQWSLDLDVVLVDQGVPADSWDEVPE